MAGNPVKRERAPRNRTLTCGEDEMRLLTDRLLTIKKSVGIKDVTDRIILGDTFEVIPRLPSQFVNLLVLDPPYNLSKDFHGHVFKEKEKEEYATWFENLIVLVKPLLKVDATVYVCSDWKTSLLIAPILEQYFFVRNRITWEREKGRGAKTNWKNNTEDVWFCTVGERYKFDVDAVMLKRKVIAPYRVNGQPKDWNEEESGNYRLTYPSNIWSDITIPFWSMPENTDHPTQKPEKLIAKLILASSEKGDFVFDPFVGSGTTAVVANKLERHFCGIEQNLEYCCWAQKRLSLACHDRSIQGYTNGYFWERNTLNEQNQFVK